MVELALIEAFTRPQSLIYGRPALERLIATCEQVGIKRFLIVADENAGDLSAALGKYRDNPAVRVIEDSARLRREADPEISCVVLHGNLVITVTELKILLRKAAAFPEKIVAFEDKASPAEGIIAAGALGKFDKTGKWRDAAIIVDRLPIMIAARHGGERGAELKIARSLRLESAERDAPMARCFDRRISWRISDRLSHTRVTPNQVTWIATAMGLLSAWLFAIPIYRARLAAAALFILTITLDGVDGELARLKMAESRFGARLDTVTDNVVHLALFAGIMIGCYRASGNSTFWLLLILLLGGFTCCVIVGGRARTVRGDRKWLLALERATGRDFAYILLLLAIAGRIEYFAWGAAFGSFTFAGILGWMTLRQARPAEDEELLAGDDIDKGAIHNRGLLRELTEIWRVASHTARHTPSP